MIYIIVYGTIVIIIYTQLLNSHEFKLKTNDCFTSKWNNSN